MTLTYIFHSGFVLETDKSILIFDYWLDLNGVVPPFLKKDKPVYVFSSHFHEDHFNSAIWGRSCNSPATFFLHNTSKSQKLLERD